MVDTTDFPYGDEQLQWKNRAVGIKTQERMASYLANKLLDKKSSSGELGVIETREYTETAIEDKSQKENTLQVLGREAVKQK